MVGIEHDRPGKQGGWPAGMKQGRDLVGRKGGRGRTLLSSNPSLVKLDILGLLGGQGGSGAWLWTVGKEMDSVIYCLQI